MRNRTGCAAPAQTDDGYRGIWYMNQPTGDEYKFKYSGGLGTYPQQHTPIAIYRLRRIRRSFATAATTASRQAKELACMVSYFDHATGQVPRPRIVVVQADGRRPRESDAADRRMRATSGCFAARTARRRIRTSFAARPYSIDEFEQVARTNFSYSQPWFVPGEDFCFCTHGTRTAGGCCIG